MAPRRLLRKPRGRLSPWQPVQPGAWQPPPWLLLGLIFMLSWQPLMSLDNGVARTPPMGWMTWERFGCNTGCQTDPDNCIGEKLLKAMADHMVADGYRDVGYQYVAIDDCWLSRDRDSQGRLQANPEQFPSGMKALADYVHSLGLKLGIYEDIGVTTCAGFPGSEGHLQIDAQTFADWGVDMLKFDGCQADLKQYDYGYPAMGHYLNKTGRHIVYSCEWPMYAKAHHGQPDYPLIAATCNMFRVRGDLVDAWSSVRGMIEYFGGDEGNFTEVAGPGAWNDPDQVVVGNFGLSHDQERVQMALWAIMASPIMASVDLRTINKASKGLLQNKGVLAINQDKLGIQGRRLLTTGELQVWTRPVVPPGSWAVAFLYEQEWGGPTQFTFNLTELGLQHGAGYNVTEVFANHHLGYYKPKDNFSCYVNPTGVYLIKAVPM